LRRALALDHRYELALSVGIAVDVPLGCLDGPMASQELNVSQCARVLDKLKIQKADLVTHDIGNMVGYAFAAQFPARVTRWVIIDAPLPGIGPWDEIIRSPALWHFNFRGPDVERLLRLPQRTIQNRASVAA
jgi:pimeloyl-ACP methyl ester carboxylesterase